MWVSGPVFGLVKQLSSGALPHCPGMPDVGATILVLVCYWLVDGKRFKKQASVARHSRYEAVGRGVHRRATDQLSCPTFTQEIGV